MAGTYRMALPAYCLGWLCYRIVIMWPLRWYHLVPAKLLGRAWSYANDGRQMPSDAEG